MSEMINKSGLMAAVCKYCDLHGECELKHCELTDVINELPTEDIVHCGECINGKFCGHDNLLGCRAFGEYHYAGYYCFFGKKRERKQNDE